MEVRHQLISVLEPPCSDRKLKERLSELQERRRSLQTQLSTRLAELRRICLQEAELTGAVPGDFPLEAGEKPPCVRRRGGTSRSGNRKCRVEEDDCQRFKPKKILFSGALRKHSDSEHNTHSQTHTHHGKRTVHRGCHTDDTVQSESSSTSDSTGHDNNDGVSLSRPPLVSTGSPVEVFNQNPTWKNSVHSRSKHCETLQTQNPRPQSQRQQSQPSQPITLQQQLIFNCSSAQKTSGAPPAYLCHHGNQRRVTVTRTKSCGPFLVMQQSQADAHHQPPATIQPDPHPHLLPPRPAQLPPHQDSQLEEATRSLHKALALEGLRDWYLRNTLGSPHQNQVSGNVTTESNTKLNSGVKGQIVGGGALQRRRTTHSVIQQSTNQREASHHYTAPHPKQTLPHSATFHGHPLHGRSVEKSFCQDLFFSQKQEVHLKDPPVNQPSPGTLV
ncbi:FERM domain-containing protein 4B isoform X2 [Kryptolebias marmoratus]|uniref:FERM domain-containing protein 4B isoform X2 n=1 Tax=Kryptolebias marmoratus TaxID=37003 RepID=UPI0007F890E3|nr:FERM domain-containing protein 4B isoform X2 [Kryptolebias marmoratus]